MYLEILLLGLVVARVTRFFSSLGLQRGYLNIEEVIIMEHIEISTKTQKEAIEILESEELSAKVSTSELYSM